MLSTTRQAFKKFLNSSSASGIILILCVAISLAIANSYFATDLQDLLQLKIGFENKGLQLRYQVLTWINDGLMAIFFLLVGLEIKREITGGQLSTIRQASLPVLAALGGAIVPALIYSTLNHNDSNTSQGWGIPMATDIAFALGVLSLLGSRVPSGLKVFLAALAIADDLMAILVIAIFYSGELHTTYLLYAGVITTLLFLFNRLNIQSLWFYLIPGVVLWYCIHHSGIHATIAGVITALAIPAVNKGKNSSLIQLEHFLTRPVNFIIMPVFAIANTNITFEGSMVGGLISNLGLGIVAGLLIGKPVGILLMSWLSVKLKVAKLPAHIYWPHIIGAGLLGGIGFTMSIFMAMLSFDSDMLQAEAKFAILITSVLAGTAGYIFLKLYSQKEKTA